MVWYQKVKVESQGKETVLGSGVMELSKRWPAGPGCPSDVFLEDTAYTNSCIKLGRACRAYKKRSTASLCCKPGYGLKYESLGTLGSGVDSWCCKKTAMDPSRFECGRMTF